MGGKRITHRFSGMMRKAKKINACVLLLLAALICLASRVQAEGDTRYDTAMNLPFNQKAGNVNPQTGNVTINLTDLELPGRGEMSFKFSRFWNLNQANAFNMYRDPYDGSNKLNSETIEKYNRLGVGWSTNLPYIFKDTSSGLQVVYLSFGGAIYELDQSGLALYRSRTHPDRSNILYYDLLDLRVYEESEIVYGNCPLFAEVAAKYEIGDKPGDYNKYVLILKDNSKYWFRPDGQLMMEEDRTGLNRNWYFYDTAGRLKLVVDSANRHIRFSYDQNGNLASLEWDVTVGVINPDGQREQKNETRQVLYHYESAEKYNYIRNLKPFVVNYRQPFLLTGVTDPEGNTTRYVYQEGPAYFTYNSAVSRSCNVYMLLREIITMEDAEGHYKNKQCFEYEIPARGMYTKNFYQGYTEYYKVSRQYFLDRHGRVMHDTTYRYREPGEGGPANRYSTVIRKGNVTTTYTYTLSTEKSRDHVLAELQVETDDGFLERRDFVYNNDRAKILEEVYRGQFLYRERFQYDRKGNLRRYEDKMGLVTVTEYDDKYSIPVYSVKKLEVEGYPKEYEREWIINDLGQVIKEIVYLEQPGGGKRKVTERELEYDRYGNIIKETDALGNSVHTVYDKDHVFPVKVYREVTVADWSSGEIADNWFTEPDRKKKILVRSWQVFNSDGTLWLEIDNDGYALEHYYDKNRANIKTVLPDADDVRSFTQQGGDFSNFLDCPQYQAFLASRQNNPMMRREIFYTEDFIKTYTDLDVAKGEAKVTGEQRDGLGNVEEEIEYDAAGNRYAVKTQTYDDQGRLITITDPDAGPNYSYYTVHGVRVKQYDKTWIIEYDDLGRQKWIIYPRTEPGRTDTKYFAYNDQENSVTITDPLGRRTYEKRDWNDNLIKVIRYGDRNTPLSQAQEYTYAYDKLNRMVNFTDSLGNTTAYLYDERDLLVKETHGTTGSISRKYNDLGLLSEQIDRKGQVLVLEYDEMGRNTAIIHYESLQEQQNNRPVRRVETVYDNRGNPVRVSSEALIEYYVYDHSNRVTKLERRLKSPVLRQQVARVWGGNPETQSFAFTYKYNDAGMVTEMVYPDGSVHRYEYDGALGRLEQIKAVTDTEKWLNEGGLSTGIIPFVTALEYTPSGIVTRMEYANRTVQTWEFDNRKRISRIQISNFREILEDLNYKLDGVGNILAINENEYGYDGFDRITKAKTLLPGNVDQKKLVTKYFGTYQGGAPINGIEYDPRADLNGDGRINGMDHLLVSLLNDDNTYDQESFEYDQNGNRVKLIQNGDTYTYEYGERNRLEAVYRQKAGAANPRLYLTFTYDANGNTIARTVYNEQGEIQTQTTFTYDTLNRVTRSVEGGRVTEYFYDNAGNRFIKKGPEGTTLYLRHGQIAVAMDIEIPVEQAEYVGKINRYVMSGDLLAGRITTTVKNDGTKEVSLYYYHLDHLNSTKIVSDEEGMVDVRYVYRAFGEQLAKIGEGDARYTYSGKELDSETSLYYFNARYYDAAIGRFISEDPAQDGTNWYVYADNNPLRLVDPTGLSHTEIIRVHTSKWGTINYIQGRNIVHNFIGGLTDTTKTQIINALSLTPKVGPFFTGLGMLDARDVGNYADSVYKLDEWLINYEKEIKGGDYSILYNQRTTVQITNITYINKTSQRETMSNRLHFYLVNNENGELIDLYSSAIMDVPQLTYNIENNSNIFDERTLWAEYATPPFTREEMESELTLEQAIEKYKEK